MWFMEIANNSPLRLFRPPTIWVCNHQRSSLCIILIICITGWDEGGTIHSLGCQSPSATYPSLVSTFFGPPTRPAAGSILIILVLRYYYLYYKRKSVAATTSLEMLLAGPSHITPSSEIDRRWRGGEGGGISRGGNGEMAKGTLWTKETEQQQQLHQRPRRRRRRRRLRKICLSTFQVAYRKYIFTRLTGSQRPESWRYKAKGEGEYSRLLFPPSSFSSSCSYFTDTEPTKGRMSVGPLWGC